MTSTRVAPQQTAASRSTRAPFPEVTGLPPGSAASNTDQIPATATLSADRRYRYLLTRQWGSGPRALFVGLNPSTADAGTDDPTTRRIVGFAQSAGCGSMALVNLYAWRSTSPSVLRQVTDPIGPDNDQWIAHALSAADIVVIAWGTHAGVARAAAVIHLLAHSTIWCLGRTKDGHPRHPLYVPARTPLELYRSPTHDWTDWSPVSDSGLQEPLRERICPTCAAEEISVDDQLTGVWP